MHATRARKWALTSRWRCRGPRRGQSVRCYNWDGRKSIRNPGDLPKGSHYLIADNINGNTCLVGVSVAGYFLDQAHVMCLQWKPCITCVVSLTWDNLGHALVN